ncbi:MAG: tRNA (N6-threonylcarbamoyladenosine(37)-N6)-methyltransferase TrmO [Bryobacteraceae bacterium]|nr:tRNA (N6-threonylcarbamoyladenosine(37)-N6)-methyltransferase TrmO [Bryobacteraceae bacterium]
MTGPQPSPAGLTLRPVGVVHSEIRDRKKMPAWGAPAEVEIFSPYEPALHRIEKHTHLWILAWLVQGRDERDVLQVTPRGVTDRGPAGLHGVFAVRSPARPNPIGMTTARLLARNGLRLRLDALDFLDQTPVLDIKPYFVTRDMIFSASGRQIGAASSREALRDSLSVQAAHFHGSMTPCVAWTVRVVEHFRWSLHELNDPPSWNIAAPAHRLEVADALMGMTRVSLGRGTLRLHGEDAVEFIGEARYERLEPLPPTAQAILAAHDSALFRVSASSRAC